MKSTQGFAEHAAPGTNAEANAEVNAKAIANRRGGNGNVAFGIGALSFLGVAAAMILGLKSEYALFAGYVVLQFIVLATGWNILGGYAGYVNFGAGGYFAVGAYTGVALFKAFALPLPVLILASAAMGAALGLCTSALTARLRGVYFSIATLAISIILETAATNWEFIGGARGIAVMRPPAPAPFGSYQQWLFFVMAVMVVFAVAIARYVERSRIGRGLRAIRDEEIAAECAGVPTRQLKLAAAAISGAIMSAAGAPFAMYLSFIEPVSVFSLNYALSAIAMPIIGGTSHWIGPVLGAVLLGSVQQVVQVSFSGAANVLVIGALLIIFVIAAPEGIVGLARGFMARRRAARKGGEGRTP